MKYDVTKCNNLNFKLASGLSGFMKVSPKGDCYLYQHDEYWDINTMMLNPRFWRAVESAAFDSFVEDSELQIVPRVPETYTDWKVGDRVCCMDDTEAVYVIAAKLGEVVFLSKNNSQILTLPTDILVDDFKLILTDYEKELIHAQELEEKQKECPFREGDKILVRDYDSSEWRFAIFASYNKDSEEPYQVKPSLLSYRQCIPLNEHTWKLLGTTDEYKATNNNGSH